MTVRIETVGSIFEIDEDDRRYRRFPKQEAPREKPEWGGVDAGALQDFVWHEYVEWRIVGARLVIQLAMPDEQGLCPTVTAPL